MARVLIAYDTAEGQSRRISNRMAELVRRRGHAVTVRAVDQVDRSADLAEFQAAIIGGSIHAGRHSSKLVRFVKDHWRRLEQIPSGFFSVSLSAAGNETQREEARQLMDDFLRQTDWSPRYKWIVAGALLYREYGFFKRWMMKRIVRAAGGDTDTSRNFEYTDWDQVREQVAELIDDLDPANAAQHEPIRGIVGS